ncbi:acyltransferase family protein [Anaerostipes faecis]|uniref:acyltransferase family protein n=1 Tax=Anaerostipes faecis TaxID=2880702 RepID=UPI0011DCC9F9|nr:acyltransferase family protein [Anaerostipes faecis]
MLQKNCLYTRNPYFDNLKFGLILLVVIGHMSDLLKDSSFIMSVIRSGIYFFHMPLFVFVSGYFSYHEKFSIKKNFLKVINLFGWYILFKFGLFFEHYFLLGESSSRLSLFLDGGVPWYLIALIIWQLLIPYILLLERKKVQIVLILIGLAAGCVQSIGDYMALSRIFVFGIFFYGGMYFKQAKTPFFITISKKYRVLAGILLLISFFLTYICHNYIVKLTIFSTGRYSYHICNVNNLQGIVLRGFFLLLAVWFGVLFMCIISPNEHIYTKWGKNTLQVYILHTFIYVYFLNHKQFVYDIANALQGKIILIILSVVVTIFLSGEWISQWFKKISFIFLRIGKTLLYDLEVEEKHD